MGLFGGCHNYRCAGQGSILIVKLPSETTTSPRVFIVLDVESEIYYLILYRSYIALRPVHMTYEKLFIFYQLDQFRAQVVCLNTFAMRVATYL